MLTLEQCTYVANGHKLTFGIYAFKQFNLATGTYPSISSVAQYLAGPQQLNGIIELIRAGYEQGNRKVIDVYDAAEIVQALTPEQQDAIMNLFLSSIVGEDFTLWIVRQKEVMDKLEAEAGQQTTNSTSPEADPKP